MNQSKKLDLRFILFTKLFSQLKFSVVAFLLACVVLLFSRCAPVFSDLQSAKLLGPGNFEATPSFSSVSVSSEGESEHIQNHFGIQAGYGIFSKMDFRLRYERISVDMNSNDSFNVNVLGFGPKFSLLKDWIAFYVPVGFAFGEDIEVSDTWQVHPTLLFTLPISKYFEFNPSAKVLIPFKSEQDTLVAFNLGLAISTNLEKWAIRPEIGFLYNPGESGHFMHLSIGFSYYIR
ncbi:MAG: hypothetical protein WBE11_15910 [Candidatus Aminicenantaceae bacterium]